MEKYPDFEEKCGYGSVTGIGGANCRHSFWPFVEGVMERTYSDSELEGMKPENRPKTVYEGREYDDYQATQMQRRVEREIRKEKRRQTAYKAAGLEEDAENSRIRLQQLNAKYREFSQAAGLPEQRERMKVQYVNNASNTKAAKRVAIGLKNDILRSTDGGDIPVTEAAIQRVPRVHPSGWTEEQSAALQSAHKALLRQVIDFPLGAEVGAVYSTSMRLLNLLNGEIGAVGVPALLEPYCALHTHPDGLTFSIADIWAFINRFDMSLLTAVGNDGSVYVLHKLEHYVAADFYKEFLKVGPRLEACATAEEFAQLMNEFLKGADTYGVEFIFRR